MDEQQPDPIYSAAWADYVKIRDSYPKTQFSDLFNWFWNHFNKINTRGMDHTLSDEEVESYRQLREDHQLTEEGLRRFQADARIGINMGWDKD